MSYDPKYLLEDLIFDLTEIQASDILAHVDFEKKDIYRSEENPLHKPEISYPLDSKWNNILRIAQQNKRQSDTDTLCLAIDGIQWTYKGKEITSPLWLIPVSWKINKVKQTVELLADLENTIFNPFVRNELKRRYDLSWLEGEDNDIPQKSKEFYDFLQQHDFPFVAVSFSVFGNFHHHRYQIVRDLEALAKVPFSPLVDEMLGNAVENDTEALTLTPQHIVSADKDQKAVFSKVQSGNLVIQGPPGTGKSQVLTNLLAKLLHRGKMNLVVSEKKAALEVLVKKLAVHGLDAFAFISHNKSRPADFVSRLRDTWQILENKHLQPEKNLLLSEQLLAQLQLTLDKLASKNLIGGISLPEFRKLLAGRDLSRVAYRSDVPSVAEWLEHEPVVKSIATQISSFEVLKHLKQKALSEATALDQVLLRLEKDIVELAESLSFTTFGELEMRLAQTARSQILENESYKKYARLFSSKRDRQKFDKLRRIFQQQSESFDLLQPEAALWKNKPALSQAQSWKAQLAAGWWKKRNTTKQIRAALANSQVLPETAVENWLTYLARESELQATVAALQALGIERPQLEMESVHYLLSQLDKEDSNELNQVAMLPETLRKALIRSGNHLQNTYRELKHVIKYDLTDPVLETIRQVAHKLPEILLVQQKLQTLPSRLYLLLQQSASLEEVAQIILKSNWTQFESHFPELAKFDGSTLKQAIQKIIDSEAEEAMSFGRNLFAAQSGKFAAFHQLLRTPAAKLQPEEKALKAVLKAGKSVLVKEFSKTRQHKTIRELLDSDARHWIEVLTPIWLSTATQVAASFPMETGLFECVIFDEASQIPLSHALGALQRARRAIVAGDEQQMSPGSYFSGVTAAVDLLHQASYYWPKSALKHHYRSMHPELIAFSNRFFYQDELIAYPSAGRSEQPVKLHYIPEGVYDGRQNVAEAQAIAQQLQQMIGSKETIGIVAFSEQQLDCIWKQLPPETQDALTQRIESGTAFFKALEQVQGDECDRLLVSLGYGKNPDGEFHLRFGPLNRKNGSKRLNVLLSRAKRSIDFYTSIRASDLSLSTNEAVNLLRFFLQENEAAAPHKPLVFPFGLQPVVQGNSIRIEGLAETLTDAGELVTLQEVLQGRNWTVSY